jgi:hypothetical protein
MFSATDIERIDETALRLLSDPGVRLEHDGVIARLLAAEISRRGRRMWSVVGNHF